MLTRLYIDNYGCNVNLDYRPGKINVLLGGNGSGKSTILRAIGALQAFSTGEADVLKAFPQATLTRWESRLKQRFEATIEDPNGSFEYILVVEHNLDEGKARVFSEEISYGGRPLFRSELGQAQLYRDDHTLGPAVSVDWTRSALPTLTQRRDNVKLAWLWEWFLGVYCVHPNPTAMSDHGESEDRLPNYAMSNLASWLRHISQEDPFKVTRVSEMLAEIFPGFKSLSLQKEGEKTRVLKASIEVGGRPQSFLFSELSEGQRALVALYLLALVPGDKPSLLCIDEPDNYVSLREIQPWLSTMQGAIEDSGSQMLVISHHPEVLDYLIPVGCVVVSRGPDGPSRLSEFRIPEGLEDLRASEVLARGWDDV